MLQTKRNIYMTVFDFLLYMESGPVLPSLCRTPIINRYMFDILIRGYSDDKTSIHYDAAGPLQVTNIFLKEYLFDSNPDESAQILQMLVDVSPNFAQIPLYQLQSVCGFLNRHNFVNTNSTVSKVFIDVVPLIHCEKTLINIYKRYFGAESSAHVVRINNYVSNYLSNGIRFIDGYADEGKWDVN